MPRDPWNDFLNGGGPSTPRGRGRGGGGAGGRGGFSGGSGRGGYTPKRSFNANYTNMGLDYDQLNSKKGYGRMDGFSVDPFGSATAPAAAQENGHGGSPYTPSRGRGGGGFRGRGHGRGEHTPSSFQSGGRGRGRGRGGGIGSAAAVARDTPSGARTPVTGLGYHAVPGAGAGAGAGKGKGKAPAPAPVRALAPRSTVGKGLSEDGRVLWGGAGGAPLFVKAGELFKDGEVDVITHDEDKEIPVDGPASPRAAVAHRDVPLLDGREQGSRTTTASKSVPAAQTVTRLVQPPAPAQPTSTSRPSETAAAAATADVPVADPRAPVSFATHDAFSFFGTSRVDPNQGQDDDAEVEIYEFGKSGTVSTIKQPRAVATSAVTVQPSTSIDLGNIESAAEKPSPNIERDIDMSSVPATQTVPDETHGDDVEEGLATVANGETIAESPETDTAADKAVEQRESFGSPPAPISMDEADEALVSGPYSSDAPPPSNDGDAITEPEPVTSVEVDMESLVFIDTAPATSADPPALYETSAVPPVGAAQSKSSSEEEEVVFKPRTYKQPKPIQVNMPPKPTAPGGSRSAALAALADGTLADEPTMPKISVSRKAKKAAKKEKRKTRGTGKKAARRSMVVTGSDVEWGSDGPPRGGSAEGVEDESGEEDMEVLRDYLAGTILNGANDGDDDESEEEEEDKEARGDAHPGLGSAKSDKLVKGRMGAKSKRAKEWDDAPEEILDMVLDASASGDDSSELGDLEAVMAALDSDDGSGDDSDEDEEQLFKGENAWSSEDENDWFVRSMEEALSFKSGPAGLGGPTGKGKGKSGLFGLGGMEEVDDFDLPTVPVKKGKKKVADVPEELQAQWEADRRKKAAKKQERELERILSQLAAAAPSGSRATKGQGKGKGGGGKAKGGAGKASSKAQAAALAHLIPASASAVADMFDVSSDEAMSVFGLGGRVRARRGVVTAVRGSNADDDMDVDLSADEGLGMAELVSQIRVFVRDAGRTTFTLPPMDKDGRRRMHMLAECFDLKSKSKGAGKGRFTILIKTSRSGMNVDENAVERLVAASEYTGGHFYKAFYTRGRGKFAPGGYGGGGGGGGGGASRKGPPGDRGQTARAKDGDLVGGGAERIGAGNIGHRLLSMMGWAEGGRIGRMEGGLEQPIVAVVKNTKSGLGA